MFQKLVIFINVENVYAYSVSDTANGLLIPQIAKVEFTKLGRGEIDLAAPILHECNSSVTNARDVTRHRLSDEQTTHFFSATRN
jgi:hypothetical protein